MDLSPETVAKMQKRLTDAMVTIKQQTTLIGTLQSKLQKQRNEIGRMEHRVENLYAEKRQMALELAIMRGRLEEQK